jgi:predicted enzyme related to lactoylglutathione lyase
MFLGLRTVIYAAPDLAAARRFYTAVLRRDPYFDEPFYVGFDAGGYELGLDPAAEAAVAYWGVEDCGAGLRALRAAGAAARTDVTDVGEGIRVASATDPLGNVVGVIENPHFGRPR